MVGRYARGRFNFRMSKKITTVFLYDTTTQGPLLKLLYQELRNRGAQVILAHYNRLYGLSALPTWLDPSLSHDLTGKPLELNKLLSQSKPKILVLFDKGSLLDRAVIRTAQHQSIPTIQVQHGLVSSTTLEPRSYSLTSLLVRMRFLLELFITYCIASVANDPLFFFRATTYWYIYQLFRDPHRHYHRYRDEVLCNKVAAFSPEDRKFFIDCDGYSFNQVRIVGQPFLDSLYQKLQQKKSNVGQSEPYFLLISQPFVEDMHEGWTAKRRASLIKSCARAAHDQGYKLVVKLHPRENRQDYTAIQKTTPGLIIAEDQAVLDDLVLGARGVLGFFSTALSMAVVTHKPLGILRFSQESFLIDYVGLGVGVSIGGAKDLSHFMKRAIAGDIGTTSAQRKKYIDHHLGYFDGKSIDRIIVQIDTGLVKKG